MKFTTEEFLAKLPLPANEKWVDGVHDISVLVKNNVELVFFAPRGEDRQTFHEQDEFYFIVAGSADLHVGGRPTHAAVGDVLFVEAHAEHHFENISDDFACWAIFF